MRRGHGRRRKLEPRLDPSSPDLPILTVESLDQEGRGVGHADGKVIFIEGALAGERVSYASHRRKPSYEIAEVGTIQTRPSVARVVPRCPHFGVCGGCSMQHLEATSQVAVKQRVLEDHLWHIGRVRADRMLPPIHGPAWGYRHRARISVRIVEKKGGALVGFHERRSSFVADMRECHVVPPHVSALLVPLRALIESLSIGGVPAADRTRHRRETTWAGSRRSSCCASSNRRAPPTRRCSRRSLLEHDVVFWLQPKGPDTIVPLAGHVTDRAALRPARVRRAHPLPADRLHAGQRADQSRAGRSCACACSTCSPTIASPTCSAASATSRCRSLGSRREVAWWPSKAAG